MMSLPRTVIVAPLLAVVTAATVGRLCNAQTGATAPESDAKPKSDAEPKSDDKPKGDDKPVIDDKPDFDAMIDELASRGKGLVVVSSETEELMLLCDRIAVLSAGRLVRVFERGEWSQENLLAASFEGYAGTRSAEGESTR